MGCLLSSRVISVNNKMIYLVNIFKGLAKRRTVDQMLAHHHSFNNKIWLENKLQFLFVLTFLNTVKMQNAAFTHIVLSKSFFTNELEQTKMN